MSDDELRVLRERALDIVTAAIAEPRRGDGSMPFTGSLVVSVTPTDGPWMICVLVSMLAATIMAHADDRGLDPLDVVAAIRSCST